ncbi:MAG: SDR family NAD(P)-dependent oxidoreductase [Ferruginibacter sp.]
MTRKKWLITGVSSGLGKELATMVHQNGEQVIGIVRKEKDKMLIEKQLKSAKVYVLDLLDSEKIEFVVDEILKNEKKIDVLVNNAGYGLFGFVEEVNAEELLHQFKVNFFSVWTLIQKILPSMRKRESGLIINISSRLGLVAGVGNAAYAATKFATEGMSEALEQEVKNFGIKVMLVEPGPMRTHFFGGSVNFARTVIPDYIERNADIRAQSKSRDGKQKGNPKAIAKVIYELSNGEDIPLRLPLTSPTLNTFIQKQSEMKEIIEKWTDTAKSVDFIL